MSKVFDTVLGMRWAILPEALEQIFSVLNRDYDPEVLSQAMHGEVEALKYLGEEGEFKKKAVVAMPGNPLPNARNVKVRDSVAILPVIGPIFPRANLFTEWSGGVSIDQVALDFNVALESDQVDTIVFNIDSPGGEITGVSEFANMIFEAGCGGGKKKRIIAYASGMMASAAYWIGAACDELFVNATSEVGSIGVVAGFTDCSERDQKSGVRRIEIISSQSPNKRANPTTDTGRAVIQGIVDQLADIFISEVAKFRKIEMSEVLTEFGKGGLVIGADAVKRKMADEVKSLEGIISLSIEQSNSKLNNGGFFMEANEKQVEFSMTVEAVKESSPEVYNKIRTEGFEAGRNHERERIQGIEGLKAPGYENIVADEKFNPDATKENVAAKVLEAQEQKRSDAAKAVQDDGKEVADKLDGVESGSGAEADETTQANSAIKAMVDGANEKRK
jgi:ClpP class serine protease